MDDDAWFWTPEWQELIAAAEADRQAGNFTQYASERDFLAALDHAPGEGSSHEADAARLAADSAYVAEVRAVRDEMDELGTW